jgi:hypothetical protein
MVKYRVKILCEYEDVLGVNTYVVASIEEAYRAALDEFWNSRLDAVGAKVIFRLQENLDFQEEAEYLGGPVVKLTSK